MFVFQSCSKAWEYRGFVAEKEHAYKDAATYYEKAWRFGYHADPTVGKPRYVLSFYVVNLIFLLARFQVGIQLPEGEVVCGCY